MSSMSLDPTDPVALALALIRCPSVTPHEAGALTLIERVLEPEGWRSHRMTMREPGTPDVENLYARAGAEDPNLCFAGHTDVVPAGREADWRHPPFAGVVDGGVLYGRGAVDMKGAIACFMAAAVRCRRAGSARGSISFLITGDEEGPSINGTMKVLDWMKERGEVLAACVVGEPSNPSELGQEIKIGRRGSLSGRIVVAGKQGHVAYPQLAENPIPKLLRLLDSLTSERLDAGNADFEPSNLEVTIIGTPNTATNVIPAEVSATFNIRYNTHWTRPRLEAWARARCDAAAASCGARYALTFSGTGDVFLTKPGPLVETMRAAVSAVTGRTPALTTNGGTSDARFIQAHCPVIEFGLTNALAHHVDECVRIEDLHRLTAIYERFIAAYFAAR